VQKRTRATSCPSPCPPTPRRRLEFIVSRSRDQPRAAIVGECNAESLGRLLVSVLRPAYRLRDDDDDDDDDDEDDSDR